MSREVASVQRAVDSKAQALAPAAGKAARATPTSTLVQRKCACGGAPGADGECAECRKKRLGVQTKLRVSLPGDRFEQEADRIADQVVNGGKTDSISSLGSQRGVQFSGLPARRAAGRNFSLFPGGSGQELPSRTRGEMEARFGHDFSRVRIHTDRPAARVAQRLGARAFTVGREISFAAGEFDAASREGRRLIAHELTHVLQQGRATETGSHHGSLPSIQRVPAQPEADAEAEDELTGPLSDREWKTLERWQNAGEVGVEPLTGDADHNALVVASSIFCSRFIGSAAWDEPGDPLLCVLPSVTSADPRVRQLVPEVTLRGPIINWAQVDPDQRILIVMELLVNTHGFPVNGAAGLVGNLFSESGVLPNRVEGSRPSTPQTAQNFAGVSTEFTAEEVRNRDRAARQGPRRPGVGLAQWTSVNRRARLFQHTFQGIQLGAAILFNMEAQVDFLVSELQDTYGGVFTVLNGGGVSVNSASDEVVYRFEVPGAVIGDDGRRLPRSDPAVQAVFSRRRANSQRALRVFQEAHP